MPIGAQLVNVEMPTNSSLIAQFRKAKVMTAFAQGQLFQFNLNQTAQLLPSLLNCVVSGATAECGAAEAEQERHPDWHWLRDQQQRTRRHARSQAI